MNSGKRVDKSKKRRMEVEVDEVAQVVEFEEDNIEQQEEGEEDEEE